MDEFEFVEDNRLVPCAYCSKEFDLISLLSHLEDKHPLGSQSTAGTVSLLEVDRENHLTEEHTMTSVHDRKLNTSATSRSQGSTLLGRNQRDSRDKHLVESRSTAGPVSLAEVDWGFENHLTEEHMMTSERGRKLDISAVPRSQESSPLRRNQRDLKDSDFEKFYGSGRLQFYKGHSSSASADPVIPSFRLNTSEKTNEITKYFESFMEESSESKNSECLWKSSFEYNNSLSREEWKERIREAAARSAFVQDMLVSALLPD